MMEMCLREQCTELLLDCITAAYEHQVPAHARPENLPPT